MITPKKIFVLSALPIIFLLVAILIFGESCIGASAEVVHRPPIFINAGTSYELTIQFIPNKCERNTLPHLYATDVFCNYRVRGKTLEKKAPFTRIQLAPNSGIFKCTLPAATGDEKQSHIEYFFEYKLNGASNRMNAKTIPIQKL